MRRIRNPRNTADHGERDTHREGAKREEEEEEEEEEI